MGKWRRANWQETILAQANFLEYERNRLCDDDHQGRAAEQWPGSACHAGEAAKQHLDNARQAAGFPERWPCLARLVNVWSGALVCSAFANLHTAKVVLVDRYAEEDIQAAVPGVLTRLQACLPADDRRRQRAEALFGSPDGQACGLAMRRAALRDAMQVSYDAADEQYSRVRSFRNVLITGTVLLSMLVLAVCMIGVWNPGVISLCSAPSQTNATAAASVPQRVCPTSEMPGANAPSGGDVAIVALMGVLGAALSSTLAVQKLRGTASPYSVPVALALFKLPAGALTAVAGLLLIKGDFVPGFSQLDSQGQILAYAIVFGVAQHLVTRFVDQRADDVLSNLPSKEYPPAWARQPNQAAQPAGGS